MKFYTAALVLSLAAVVACHPGFDFEGDDQSHDQTGEAGSNVEGSYRWTSPEGEEFFVRYVADELGYRVMESNAVPHDADGTSADGNQGSFSGEDGDGEGGERK
ncbi:cuticle protein AM1199-like isoform X9 [Eriocheir sinensis]|uniref:cuticle protein AM1199-like isoform X4 n=1 Tax=Eriocheir sinensis TaxID=95602 RepID=UPI0021C6CDCC|nr:cuticle protein AM1199-like isoform X4 [Eriocheir sinensis]XP_050702020.1 cuticle protein AM1199-like isoform X5 [Eriocheir sinensis]XP_050702022.1 cuticle protein AM1199-like isoform X4 [Eriocheir sinensis]XP_050702023.1 cuticle protein AM1199-like isoform X4 [Eriocheir sinensis]XP_050702026.1 cuticle protein AM1199-like isoform X9 [Eriocheir sinensis]